MFGNPRIMAIVSGSKEKNGSGLRTYNNEKRLTKGGMREKCLLLLIIILILRRGKKAHIHTQQITKYIEVENV